MKSKPVQMMPVGSSAHCLITLSPLFSSAPRAATKPNMLSLPLMISGAPLNAMTSPKLGIVVLEGDVAGAGCRLLALVMVPLANAAAHSASL